MAPLIVRAVSGLLLAAVCAAAAQAAKPDPPGLEGLWSIASITTLERPAAFKTLELTDAEALAYEREHTGVPEPARGGPVGQEDSEWWEMGGKLGRIHGRARTSWIVDPPDGRLPYSPAGLAALATRTAVVVRADDPESRPAAERCLMGVGGTTLPPMLNAGYNGLLQIVQTRDHVVVTPEMHVGPRIIPLGPTTSDPGPAWSGHSQGRWDGDTLVVETTGFHPGAQWRAPGRLFISTTGKVTERFRRMGPDAILYSFVVDDPATFKQQWRGEIPLRRTAGPMFEFACHEGNYSMPGILAGGREQDRAADTGK